MAEEQSLTSKLGDIFRAERVKKGWTQRQAAEHAGTAQARVTYLEQGERDLMLSTIERYADLYGYNVEVRLVPQPDAWDSAFYQAVSEMETEDAEEG